MHLYKTRSGIVVSYENQFYLALTDNWDALVNRDDLYAFLRQSLATATPSDEYRQWAHTQSLAPIGHQEVWASGVTYLRSRDARMEESKRAVGETGNAATFYDRVYDAERPELFFKATPERVVGPDGAVRIRRDSTWNVPEPELTLFVTSSGTIVGYTCGNDMSSRSIEGENPLYLPQAKSYDGSAALGPCLYVPETPLPADTEIQLDIIRDEQTAFSGTIAISQMKRRHDELVSFLFRECSFPNGCYLMTGTGLVPPDDFTLASGDVIRICIDPIGVLINEVQ